MAIAGADRAGACPEPDKEVQCLERKWLPHGYHGFDAGGGMWLAISSAGAVLTGSSPGDLEQVIREHWQARQ